MGSSANRVGIMILVRILKMTLRIIRESVRNVDKLLRRKYMKLSDLPEHYRKQAKEKYEKAYSRYRKRGAYK